MGVYSADGEIDNAGANFCGYCLFCLFEVSALLFMDLKGVFMWNIVRKSIFMVSVLLCALPGFAQVTSSQVWNSTQLYNGSVSPVLSISSSNPTYTVYFKNTTTTSQDYSVSLQTSPDGINWSTVTDKSIYVSRLNPAGYTYQMTVDVKTVKARLFITPTNLSYSFMASAWVVN